MILSLEAPEFMEKLPQTVAIADTHAMVASEVTQISDHKGIEATPSHPLEFFGVFAAAGLVVAIAHYANRGIYKK
jgi:hypothetical protein